MAINVSSDAVRVYNETQANSDSGLQQLLLLQRLNEQALRDLIDLGDESPGGGLTSRTETRMFEQIIRAEGENISYGRAVRIDANTISQLGLADPNSLTTYTMDSEGNLQQVRDGINDFSGYNQEQFLIHMDGDAKSFSSDAQGNTTISSMRNDAPIAMTIQRVEVNGATQGYFLAGESQRFGIYLDTSALDLSKMSDEIKAQLMQAETPEQHASRQPEVAPSASAGLKM
ncbi:MAG: hypothetical protein KJ017_01500 [Alphaproteobacteria bacterium]|nr:hypothetical protein [Alphaproteobacteria bacterium]